MKISEIVASLSELKQTVASFIGDKARATTEALASFSGKLEKLETGALSELASKTDELSAATLKLSAANTALEKSQGEVNAIGGALKTACAAMKLEIKDGATSLEMISAMQGAVAATLAKLQVNAEKVPGSPATKAGEPKDKPKTLTQRCMEANGAAIPVK